MRRPTPAVGYIMAVTIIAYLLTSLPSLIPGDGESMYKTVIAIGGIQPELFKSTGSAWMLVTCMLLHGSLWHILGNMSALYVYGPMLERRLGPKAFVFAYIISGIGSSLLVLVLSKAGAIGASGAILGVATMVTFFEPKRIMWGAIPLWMLTGLMFIISLLHSFGAPVDDGISHIGHLGGILTGAGLAYWPRIRKLSRALVVELKNRRRRRHLRVVVFNDDSLNEKGSDEKSLDNSSENDSLNGDSLDDKALKLRLTSPRKYPEDRQINP